MLFSGNLKNGETFSCTVNQGNRIYNIFKKLVASNCIPEEITRHLKLVGTRPGTMYGLGKVLKDINDNDPPFRHILLAITTPIYKLAKFLVPF